MSSNSTLAIEASGLVKTFGKIHAVDGIDLAVSTGEVYGFLGPNGAGKLQQFACLPLYFGQILELPRCLGMI